MTALDMPDTLTVAVGAISRKLSSLGINPWTLGWDTTDCHRTLHSIDVTWELRRRTLDGMPVLLAEATSPIGTWPYHLTERAPADA